MRGGTSKRKQVQAEGAVALGPMAIAAGFPFVLLARKNRRNPKGLHLPRTGTGERGPREAQAEAVVDPDIDGCEGLAASGKIDQGIQRERSGKQWLLTSSLNDGGFPLWPRLKFTLT